MSSNLLDVEFVAQRYEQKRLVLVVKQNMIVDTHQPMTSEIHWVLRTKVPEIDEKLCVASKLL